MHICSVLYKELQHLYEWLNYYLLHELSSEYVLIILVKIVVVIVEVGVIRELLKHVCIRHLIFVSIISV